MKKLKKEEEMKNLIKDIKQYIDNYKGSQKIDTCINITYDKNLSKLIENSHKKASEEPTFEDTYVVETFNYKSYEIKIEKILDGLTRKEFIWVLIKPKSNK